MVLPTVIQNDAHFQTEMASAGNKLVVVHFTTEWCSPCQRIAPFLEQLPAKYPRAVFLKVIADESPKTADAHRVGSFPTFVFYKNRTKIDDVLRKADTSALENKVKQYYGSEEAEGNAVAGHTN